MAETKRFTIRLKPVIRAYINEYRGKRTETQFINEAIIEKITKEAEIKGGQNILFWPKQSNL